MMKKMTMALALAMLLGGCGGGDECEDGWITPSKGKQGACSHHGGLKKD